MSAINIESARSQAHAGSLTSFSSNCGPPIGGWNSFSACSNCAWSCCSLRLRFCSSAELVDVRFMSGTRGKFGSPDMGTPIVRRKGEGRAEGQRTSIDRGALNFQHTQLETGV
jgi:hypothetical protein